MNHYFVSQCMRLKINDLIPVCPNCHAMIHRRKPAAYSIEEVKEFVAQAEQTQNSIDQLVSDVPHSSFPKNQDHT
jgi:hypothetical protein